jgi:hypothetical protein
MQRLVILLAAAMAAGLIAGCWDQGGRTHGGRTWTVVDDGETEAGPEATPDAAIEVETPAVEPADTPLPAARVPPGPPPRLRVLRVTPEMQRVAFAGYQDLVRSELQAPATPRFVKAPRLLAAYDPDRDESLLTATGQIEVSSGDTAAPLRSDYVATWRMKGNAADPPPRSWLPHNCVVIGRN